MLIASAQDRHKSAKQESRYKIRQQVCSLHQRASAVQLQLKLKVLCPFHQVPWVRATADEHLKGVQIADGGDGSRRRCGVALLLSAVDPRYRNDTVCKVAYVMLGHLHFDALNGMTVPNLYIK